MSRKSPNRRATCGQTTANNPTLWLGGCYQQQISGNEHVTVLRNVTAVPDYAPASSAWINPYTRGEAVTAPNCGTYYGYACGDGVNGNYYCQLPEVAEVSANTGSGYFSVGKYVNGYVATNETTSLSSCNSVGFKNVFANKCWQGRKGYLSSENGALDSFDYCCQCNEHHEDPSPDPIKYLAASAEYSYASNAVVYTSTNHDCEIDCGAGPIPASYVTLSDPITTTLTRTAAQSVHIERYSGNQIITACSSGSTDNDKATADLAFGALAEGNEDNTLLVSKYCEEYNIFAAGFAVGPDVVTGGGNSWHVEWHVDNDCYDVCGNYLSTQSVLYSSLTITATSVTVTEYALDNFCTGMCGGCSGCKTTYITRSESWTFSATTYAHILDEESNPSESIFNYVDTSCTATLSSPYTSTQCYDDAIDLLNYWDMGDSALMPWRTDGSVNKGPLVTYDEINNAPFLAANCVSENEYSGEIKGLPAPLGIDRVWDPAHENYCICTDAGACQIYYIDSYGQWSDTDIGTPRATQWVNDRDANSLPQGAFVFFNQQYTTPTTCNSTGPVINLDDKVWVGKYAEVIIKKNSINFGRYCGEDKFQLSASLARCIVGVAGNVINIEPSGPVLGYESKVWVEGTGTNDGLHTVTRNSDYQFTQTACLLSASATPATPFADYAGEGICCPLKFQNYIPGICGRVDITSVQGSPITCSLLEDTYLLDGETVFVVGASGGGLTNKAYTVKVLGSKQVVLVGSVSSSNPTYRLNSGAMYSALAHDWQWNDSAYKGNYTVIEWNFNYRDVGEYYRISASVPFVLNESTCDSIYSDPLVLVACDAPSVPPEPRPHNLTCGQEQAVTSVTATTACVAHNSCNPVVAYFAPAGQDTFGSENYPSAVNHGFPTVVYLDSEYGNKWQGMIQQSVEDPFWAGVPPCPCSDDGMGVYGCNVDVTEDDGNCLVDTALVHYYAKPPQLESMAEIPLGAPPLPKGKYLGCLNVTQFGATCPEGNVCQPPDYDINVWVGQADACYASYIPHVYLDSWTPYLAQLNCVCENGRFAEEYEDDGGIHCNNDNFFVPAP